MSFSLRREMKSNFPPSMAASVRATRVVRSRCLMRLASSTSSDIFGTGRVYPANLTEEGQLGVLLLAVGFILTIDRRRLASSFAALRNTLEDRHDAIKTGSLPHAQEIDDEAEAELPDAENEVLGREDVAEVERESLALEEKNDMVGSFAVYLRRSRALHVLTHIWQSKTMTASAWVGRTDKQQGLDQR